MKKLVLEHLLFTAVLFLATDSSLAQCRNQTLSDSIPGSGQRFGDAISLDGNVAVIGISQDDPGQRGSAAVYRKDAESDLWAFEQKLTPGDGMAGDRFGFSVGVKGDVIVIGSLFHDSMGEDAGAAYVFRRDSMTGLWSEEQKLLDATGGANDRFGVSVDVDEVIVVGAERDDDLGMDSGSAFVFRYDGSQMQWNLDQKLLASDGEAFDEVGVSVAVSGDRVATGAPAPFAVSDPGQAYVFSYDPQGQIWVEESRLCGSNSLDGDRFGFSIDIDQDQVIVGSSRETVSTSNEGAAYVFRRDVSTNEWHQEAILSAGDGSGGDQFGQTVGLSGNLACVGAQGHDGLGLSSGRAYLYRFNGRRWIEDHFAPTEILDSSQFGHAVAVDRALIFVGSPGDRGSGTVHVYSRRTLCEDVIVSASKDNTLLETATGGKSNGKGNHFFSGLTSPGFNRLRRGSIAFDIAQSVPPGSEILSVALKLNVSRTLVGSQVVQLHRALADWGEGASLALNQEGRGGNSAIDDVTWLHRHFPDDFWVQPGGDFEPAASGSTDVDAIGSYVWSGPGLVEDVQLWLDDSSSNFGWLIRSDESVRSTKRFDSRENPDVSARPELRIEYTTPSAFAGNVNENGGGVTDVLFVNDLAGSGPDRRVMVSPGEDVDLRLDEPPVPGDGRYVLWVYRNEPRVIQELVVGGQSLGLTVSATPFDPMAQVQPVICVRGNDVSDAACFGVNERQGPATVPWSLSKSNGFPGPKVFLFQCIIRDGSATNSFQYSVSNAITLEVRP